MTWRWVRVARVWGGLVLGLIGPALVADVFHLDTGGSVEGQLLEVADGNYRIRTLVGVISLPVSAVRSVVHGPTPFDEYDARVGHTADTAVEQTALGLWCREQGLRPEANRHLTRAIELDPDYVPARRALGHVRVGALWLDASRTSLAAAEQKVAGEDADDQARLLRAVQGEWLRRIRAIRHAYLERRGPRLLEEGRARILEITDPLAVLPLAAVLSDGDENCRLLLVEALSAFPQDEATLNLAVMALLDPSPRVRDRALAEMRRRNDQRVVAEYRQALMHGSDLLVARAATALGYLQADEAVPDLIDSLTARRRRWVEVPVETYLGGWSCAFSGIMVHIGSTRLLCPPRLGVCGVYGTFVPDTRNEWRYRLVTVYRTEVLEALKQITGQNFGFDRQKWHQWYAQHTQ